MNIRRLMITCNQGVDLFKDILSYSPCGLKPLNTESGYYDTTIV